MAGFEIEIGWERRWWVGLEGLEGLNLGLN